MKRLSDSELRADLDSNSSAVILYFAPVGSATDQVASDYQIAHLHEKHTWEDPPRLLAVDVDRAPQMVNDAFKPLRRVPPIALVFVSPEYIDTPRIPRAFREGNFDRKSLDLFAGIFSDSPKPFQGYTTTKSSNDLVIIALIGLSWWAFK